jgi:chromosome segregation ATPase
MPFNIDELRNDVNKLKKLFDPIFRVSEALEEFDALNSTLSEKRGYVEKYKKEIAKVNLDLEVANKDLAETKAEIAASKKKAKEEEEKRKQKSEERATEIITGAASIRDATLKEHEQAKKDLASTKFELGKKQTQLDEINEKIKKAETLVKNLFISPLDK